MSKHHRLQRFDSMGRMITSERITEREASKILYVWHRMEDSMQPHKVTYGDHNVVGITSLRDQNDILVARMWAID